MINKQSVTAVVVAAGKSTRMGFDKLFYPLCGGQNALMMSLAAFDRHEYIDEIVLVTGENAAEALPLLKACKKPAHMVAGGETRAESVRNGVAAANGALVAIHDAARPFVSADIIREAVAAAAAHGAGAPAVAVKDTIKVSQNGKEVNSTPARDTLFAVQTPQVFQKALYLQALALVDDVTLTDDCLLFEKAGYPVHLTQGAYENYKITTQDDLKGMNKMRIGHGYDVHRLVAGRKLILGGVTIEHKTGLLGHSDADVLTHAIMDALLGAAALGDIGALFPDTADEYAGADSLVLLGRVCEEVKRAGYAVGNVDATLLCQAPKLRGYIDTMRQNLAAAMHIADTDVSVKATTEEHLGFTGEELGIAAHAVVLLTTAPCAF